MKKTRILTMLGEPIVNGGQESFILNMYNNMDIDKVQIDIATPFHCENQKFVDNIKQNGGEVYIGNLSFGKDRKLNFKNYVEKFLSKHKYDTIHIQSGSIFSLMIASKLANKYNVKNIIVHSHCGGFSNIKYKVIKFLSRKNLLKYPTEYWACSKLAAEWKFPKEIINNNKFKIMKNAIDVKKIFFKKEIREKTRKDLKISDNQILIGHIGRFSIQKNHSFLIDIFKEIHNINKKAVLILIGNGELEDEIKLKVKELNVEKSVKFLGIRKDINELLNAMDVFLLPSFFEGLPVVGVEAQATGLHVVTSDKVTKELPIERLSTYCSLDQSPKEWANIVLSKAKEARENTTKEIIKCGYDVKGAAKHMQKLYIDLDKGDK